MDEFEFLTTNELIEFYLSAEDEAKAESALSHLLEKHAVAQIKTYFQRKINTSEGISNRGFTKSDAEDLASKTALDLLVALRNRRNSVLAEEIQKFEAYINTICYANYSDFWRTRFADYYKLQNRIRYLLKRRDSEFFVRNAENDCLICSLKTSPNNRSSFSTNEIIERVKEKLSDYPIEDETVLVAESLAQARGWLYLRELVETLAELRGIKYIPPRETVETDEFLASFSLPKDNLVEREKNLHDLRFLWEEIKELPRFQRLALVYNLREDDGKEVNCVWFESGIATLAELAEVFEIADAEMAELLVKLPFSDRQIAAVLGIEDEAKVNKIIKCETKIGNLRKVAREYLQRRMQGKQKRKR